MALTHEQLCGFVQKHSYVIAYTKSGNATLLSAAKPDLIALAVLYADEFEFDGRRYSWAQFEQLILELPAREQA